MNCHEIQNEISDLGAGLALTPGERRSVQVHVTQCLMCARSVENQQVLTAELRAWATTESKAQPAPAVRARLRDELAQVRAAAKLMPAELTASLLPGELSATNLTAPASAGCVAQASNVLPFRPPALVNAQPVSVPRQASFRSRQIWQRGLAVAATLLVGAMLLISWWRLKATTENQATVSAGDSTQPSLQVSATSINKPQLASVGTSVPTPLLRSKSPAERKLTTNFARPRRASSEAESKLGNAAVSDAAFIPLTLALDERALANRIVVRLDLPRSSLIALGMPLRQESSEELVNAEVMFGDNGVAYAIRLLQ